MFYSLAAIFFAFGGLLVAAALALQQRVPALGRLCGPGTGCGDVLASRYAQIGGVPLSYLGAGFYGVMVIVMFLCMALRPGRWRGQLLAAARWAAVVGVVVSAWLMGAQCLKLRVFCPLCTLSAVFMVLIAAALWLSRRDVDFAARPAGAGLLAVAFAATLGLLAVASKAPPVVAQDQVIAWVDGQAITAAQLQREGPPDMDVAQEQLYQIQRDWLDHEIDQRVLEAEASNRGVDLVQLQRSEVDEKIQPAARIIEAWAKAQPAGHDWDQAGLNAVEELRRQRRTQWLAGLRRQHNVNILLPKPPGRLGELDATYAHVLGASHPAIRLVVFGDFQCPYCMELDEAVGRIVRHYLEVSVTWFHFPLDNHDLAEPAAVAAECAAEQGRFWLWNDLMVQKHGEIEPKWEEYARQIGLDVPRFRQCMKAGAARQFVANSRAQGQKLGVQGVPTIYLNGRYIGGELSYEELDRLIQLERQRSR